MEDIVIQCIRSITLAAFKAPGADEFTGTQYSPAAEDSYRCLIERYEIREGEVTQYNPDGNPRVRFWLTPLEIDGDPEAMMVDIEDKELPEDKQFIFFFDPDHLGTKPRLAKSRKFLANALQIDYEQPVEADSLEAFCETLLNREIVCDVGVKTKGNGDKYNTITDTKKVKIRKARRQRAEKPSMVEEAEKVFNEDDGGDEDDF